MVIFRETLVRPLTGPFFVLISCVHGNNPDKKNGSQERETKMDESCKLKSYTDGGNVERNLHKYKASNN